MKVAFNITLPREDLDVIDAIMAAKRLNRSQAVHYLLMVAVKTLRNLQERKQAFQKEKQYSPSVKIVKPVSDWKPIPREMKDEKPIKTEQTKKDKHKKILP